jgi:hypothetical protein
LSSLAHGGIESAMLPLLAVAWVYGFP